MCKICKIEGCCNEVMFGRRYCREHYLERKRVMTKKRVLDGTYRRTRYHKTCTVCGKEYLAWTKSSKYCSIACSNGSLKYEGVNNYTYNRNYRNGIWAHRALARNVLGRNLSTNEVVHHIDMDPKNNSLDNLLVISRSKHAALHRFINKQGAVLKQLSNVNIENCWDTWIRETTTAWLETASAKVIKLSDVRQSAAERRIGEGSETMHDAPHVGDDIVQTTTV